MDVIGGDERDPGENMLSSLFQIKGASKSRPHVGAASPWMENPTGQDGLLLKRKISQPFPV